MPRKFFESVLKSLQGGGEDRQKLEKWMPSMARAERPLAEGHWIPPHGGAVLAVQPCCQHGWAVSNACAIWRVFLEESRAWAFVAARTRD